MNELKVNGKIISTPIADILFRLRDELNRCGIDKLHKIVIASRDARITCPYHNEGRERKPSCGVALYGDKNTPQGIVHCFACQKTVSFTQFISDCFNVNDDGKYGERWLEDNFVFLDNRDSLNIDLTRSHQNVVKYVSEAELDKYRYTHPYHYKRKMTDEIINMFDLGYDKNTDCVTFPVWDEKGRCVFVARRSVNGKFFNYPEDASKPVYALNKIPKDVTSVIVVESFFNALTLWTWGYYAVALLGLGSEEQYEILRKSDIREFILCFDGDDAGRKATNNFIRNLGKDKFIKVITMIEGKDVNDLTQEEFEALPITSMV